MDPSAVPAQPPTCIYYSCRTLPAPPRVDTSTLFQYATHGPAHHTNYLISTCAQCLAGSLSLSHSSGAALGPRSFLNEPHGAHLKEPLAASLCFLLPQMLAMSGKYD
mmetsp:Transcript_20513/g.35265  ORF Transcript_20513/g.35265 Transcript_20513/m.35265 type:complete len:107 (-) Transcript_20513:21-341(-)